MIIRLANPTPLEKLTEHNLPTHYFFSLASAKLSLSKKKHVNAFIFLLTIFSYIYLSPSLFKFLCLTTPPTYLLFLSLFPIPSLFNLPPPLFKIYSISIIFLFSFFFLVLLLPYTRFTLSLLYSRFSLHVFTLSLSLSLSLVVFFFFSPLPSFLCF